MEESDMNLVDLFNVDKRDNNKKNLQNRAQGLS